MKTDLNEKEIEHRIEQLLNIFDLQECKDTQVGCKNYTSTNCCSGGERKRAAIANELISQPFLCILDEPTSGLDSTNAFRVIRYLKNIAKL